MKKLKELLSEEQMKKINDFLNGEQVKKVTEFIKKPIYKKFKVWHLLIIIAVIIISPDNNSSSQSSSKSSTTTSHSSSKSVNGTYTNGGSSITISGNSWRGKVVIETGFGAAYDEQNAQYSYGVVKGEDLYDESGYLKIGYISGNSISTTIGGQRITLRKK